MTTINFPANPLQGAIYTFQDRSWIWNGRAWQSKSIFVGYTGSQGDDGEAGSGGGSTAAVVGYSLVFGG